MIARDLMNSEFPYYVTADTDAAYVAKLLSRCQAGAIQVVDEHLSPIGIVTRSNFEDGAGETVSTYRSNGRSLRDVMTPHPVSVDETAALIEVLRLLDTHKLKRIPVVNGERLVGLLLRKQVMDAARHSANALPLENVDDATAQPRGEFSAAHFRTLVAAHEQALKRLPWGRMAHAAEVADLHVLPRSVRVSAGFMERVRLYQQGRDQRRNHVDARHILRRPFDQRQRHASTRAVHCPERGATDHRGRDTGDRAGCHLRAAWRTGGFEYHGREAQHHAQPDRRSRAVRRLRFLFRHDAGIRFIEKEEGVE